MTKHRTHFPQLSQSTISRAIMRVIILSIMMLGLAACSNDKSLDDLKNFTKAARSGERSAIEPLPTIRPAEAFEYIASDSINPFASENVLPVVKAVKVELGLEIDPVLPDQDRARQPLEYFPLDSLKMVGTLKQGSQIFAIVFAPDETVHRVSKGNFAGTNLGEILQISEGEIILEETVKISNGRWEKHKVSVALSE